jgi:putative tricarboxylic transport membrane protein
MNRDFVCGCFTLAIAAGYYVLAASIPASQLDDAVGANGLPKIYGIVMAALSLILIARALMQHRRAPAMASPSEGPQSQGQEWLRLRRAAGMIAIGFLYILLVPWLGYILSLAGLITATAYYQGGEINLRVGVIAVLGAVFMWMIFVIVLQVPQPPGLWPSLF